MEKERVKLKLTEVLVDLKKGATYAVQLCHYQDLELIKAAAFPVMGPLWVSVDIRNERYVIRQDIGESYKEDFDRWY